MSAASTYYGIKLNIWQQNSDFKLINYYRELVVLNVSPYFFFDIELQ